MLPDTGPECKFIADRMLGTLTRYLRFMGYDTTSANGLCEGNTKEDTLLLKMARQEHRILLTKDAELARRGKECAVLIIPDDVKEQVQQLIDAGLVERRITMKRCSLCNTLLRAACDGEIEHADYAPQDKTGFSFLWCDQCRRLYWNGSHMKRISKRLDVE
jgi:uncharacterized protein with PIN domain